MNVACVAVLICLLALMVLPVAMLAFAMFRRMVVRIRGLPRSTLVFFAVLFLICTLWGGGKTNILERLGLSSASTGIVGSLVDKISPQLRDGVDGGETNRFLRFTAIAPGTNSTELALSWNPMLPPVGNVANIYATTSLERPAYWKKLFFVDASGTSSDIVFSVSHALVSTNHFTSAFFTAGDETDTDFDGLADADERLVVKTDPQEPDTDGDGLHDGWEVSAGFNPLVCNFDDGDPFNDPDCDADVDGLDLSAEALLCTSPSLADTDGDGITDGAEVPMAALEAAMTNLAAQIQSNPILLLNPWYEVPALSLCSNPCAIGNGDYVAVGFYFGDPSSSMSEKYLLEIAPVAGTGKGETPLALSFLNARYGVCQTALAFLKKSWRYEVRLHHASTDFSRVDDKDPDYALLGAYSSPHLNFSDGSGLFGVHSVSDSVFSGNGKVATIDVYDAEITLCTPDSGSWQEMEESRVVLDDEPLKVKISAWPCMTSAAQIKSVFGSDITLSTDATCPGGTLVEIPSDANYAVENGAGEIRFALSRASLKNHGLLPVVENDGIDEKTTTDIGSQDAGQESNLTDSEAFNSLFAESRHDATIYGNMDATPSSSRTSKSFFKAAGTEYLKVAFAERESKTRQIMNQADFFYSSGHGHHMDGSLDCSQSESITPQDIGDHWRNDIDCAVLAGCSVLDIGDFVAQRLSKTSRLDWENAGGICSPGNIWRNLGPRYFLGYGWTAPRDTQGANAIAASFVTEINSGKNPIEAWRIANDRPAGRNACAIDVSTTPAKYWYWKRNGWHSYTWDCKTEGEW